MLLQTTLQVTAQPAVEPATVELVRQHCRIDSTADDDLLASYLTAARIMAEGYLSRAMITQTLLWTVRPSSMLRPEQSRLRQPLLLPRAPRVRTGRAEREPARLGERSELLATLADERRGVRERVTTAGADLDL